MEKDIKIQKVANRISFVGLIVSILSLTVTLLIYILAVNSIDKFVNKQEFQKNIEINYQYPNLKKINSWNDPELISFMAHDSTREPYKNGTTYQTQFTILNAPNNIDVKVFIYKRITTGINIWKQDCRQIDFKSDEGKLFNDNVLDAPKVFISDLILPDNRPTSILIVLFNEIGKIIKTDVYQIQ